jgi:phage anti-repressor protein
LVGFLFYDPKEDYMLNNEFLNDSSGEELIKIEKHENIDVINARDLWEFLGSKRQFSDWIKDRLDKYGFIEGVNYWSKYVYVKSKNRYGYANKRLIEYTITNEVAKILLVSENTEKSIELLKYLIDREKEYKDLLAKFKDYYSSNGELIEGFVYIIKDYSNGYYKIGKTIDLERRLMQLRTGNVNIEIVCSLQDINYGLIETKLHRENEDRLIYGEWFDIEDRLEDIINEYGFVYHLCNKEILI